jgi:hypothetical protein
MMPALAQRGGQEVFSERFDPGKEAGRGLEDGPISLLFHGLRVSGAP